MTCFKKFCQFVHSVTVKGKQDLATGVSHGFFCTSKIALADLWFWESSRSLMDSTVNWAFLETKLFLLATVVYSAVASLHTKQNIKLSSNTNHGLPCFQLVWNDRCLWLFSYSWLLSRTLSLLLAFFGSSCSHPERYFNILYSKLEQFADICVPKCTAQTSWVRLESRVNKIKMASTYRSDPKTWSRTTLNFAL